MSYATTCGRYIARKGTEQLCKRYFQDRVALRVYPLPERAVVRAGLMTVRLALSFDADSFAKMKETAHTARLSHCPRPDATNVEPWSRYYGGRAWKYTERSRLLSAYRKACLQANCMMLR